ncbi:endoplasmic reticulum-Golgi intermediate compartment protein 1 isoform X2 [Homo sapiens]|uniref:endoplasmic reticulum-Golgi intermediate compartment protein 1 isoform X2 n=1 Tax=Homo sapiens TaxID=9606 RepID=UPI0007DC7974|nr:endoplasmic reticulum-Golgi intermediate compartment protein 1 isoform X2 [Homo sapiens]XP_047273359.1 endoplasmic reticulum-Golgi intermediate compartment protein 1 isoform X2 [Homo sapiens]|eukprot:XP_016865144.1 endoplasmic reticulum-Golgi intermediate compartment protein 1 isoform X4 [Homo sapiens]
MGGRAGQGRFPPCSLSSWDGLWPPVTWNWNKFDIYRKVPKDLTQPTYTGAIISICCCLFILFLFLSELTGFITTEVVNELYVDDPDKDSGGKIDVSLNISLPNLHCELVGLDIQDEMGRHEVGHIDNSMKIPLNNGAGCRFEGQFSINKNQELQILSQVGERSALGRAEAPGGSWQGFAQHVPAFLEARYCHSGASQQRCEAAPFDRKLTSSQMSEFACFEQQRQPHQRPHGDLVSSASPAGGGQDGTCLQNQTLMGCCTISYIPSSDTARTVFFIGLE